MISPTFLKAIGEMLLTKVEYVTKIIHNNIKELYMVIGSQMVYFFDNRFDRIDAIIEYKHIERIIVSTKDLNLFQMHMNEKKSINVPNKMNIYCLNRRSLVNYLRYSWKTDYLFNNLEVRDMPLYKKDFTNELNKDLMIETLKEPMLILMEPQLSQGYKEVILDGYRFWMPNSFSPSKQKGIYTHKSGNSCLINIQISETQPLEVLHLIGDYKNLQFYAEHFAEVLIVGLLDERKSMQHNNKQQDDDDEEDDDETQEGPEVHVEGSVKVNDYWILYSGPFIKRENIINDPAEWNGWEVDMRTKDQDIIVILMRRKYIPPLMENYDDIILVFYGPVGKDTLKDEKKQENEDSLQEEEEAKDNDDKDSKAEDKDINMKDDKLLLEAYDLQIKGQEFLILMRDMADTFQSTKSVIEQYEPLMRVHINSLSMDEQSYKFYQNRLQEKPIYIVFGIRLLQLIIKYSGVDNVEMEALEPQLRKEYQQELANNQDLISDIPVEINDDPINPMLEHFKKKLTFLQPEAKKCWSYKLSRYLAYCINGGLLGSRFTFYHYFQILEKKKDRLKDKFVDFLDFLLQANPENSDADYAQINLVKRLQKMVGQKYVYNEKIMNALLKYNFLSNSYLKGDYSQLYTEILIYILTYSRSSKGKIAVCKHIIDFHKESKDTMNEIILNSFKPLINPLLVAYQSHNKMLSTLACVALFNMCSNSREFKYLIMKEDGAKVLLEVLNSKDPNQFTYTLRLIHNLLSVVQHVEKFLSMGIVDRMFNILGGIDIRDAYYSAQALISVCRILKVCLTNDYQFKSIDKVMTILIKLYLEDAKRYILDVFNFQTLQLEALNVIGKLCFRFEDLQDRVNQEVVPHVIEALCTPVPGFKSNDILARAEKLIFFLCILIQKNKLKYRDEWIQQHPFLIDAVHECEKLTPPAQNAAYLMKELTFKEKHHKKKH